MPSATIVTELTVRGLDESGFLPGLLSVVAAAGVDVRAYCSYPTGGKSVALLVTNDAAKAQAALVAAGFQCQSSPVVLVGGIDRVGAVAEIGRHLDRAGVQIRYSYASATAAPDFVAVFKTGDEHAALRALHTVPSHPPS